MDAQWAQFRSPHRAGHGVGGRNVHRIRTPGNRRPGAIRPEDRGRGDDAPALAPLRRARARDTLGLHRVHARGHEVHGRRFACAAREPRAGKRRRPARPARLSAPGCPDRDAGMGGCGDVPDHPRGRAGRGRDPVGGHAGSKGQVPRPFRRRQTDLRGHVHDRGGCGLGHVGDPHAGGAGRDQPRVDPER